MRYSISEDSQGKTHCLAPPQRGKAQPAQFRLPQETEEKKKSRESKVCGSMCSIIPLGLALFSSLPPLSLFLINTSSPSPPTLTCSSLNQHSNCSSPSALFAHSSAPTTLAFVSFAATPPPSRYASLGPFLLTTSPFYQDRPFSI